MGVDIYDAAVPLAHDQDGFMVLASDAGFRNNWSAWTLTALYSAHVSADLDVDLWDRIEHPGTNDGDGLAAADAHALAAALEAASAHGGALAWLDALPPSRWRSPIDYSTRLWWPGNVERWIAFLRAVQGRFAIL